MGTRLVIDEKVSYIYLLDEVEQRNVRIDQVAPYSRRRVITCENKKSVDFLIAALMT